MASFFDQSQVRQIFIQASAGAAFPDLLRQAFAGTTEGQPETWLSPPRLQELGKTRALHLSQVAKYKMMIAAACMEQISLSRRHHAEIFGAGVEGRDRADAFIRDAFAEMKKAGTDLRKMAVSVHKHDPLNAELNNKWQTISDAQQALDAHRRKVQESYKDWPLGAVSSTPAETEAETAKHRQAFIGNKAAIIEHELRMTTHWGAYVQTAMCIMRHCARVMDGSEEGQDAAALRARDCHELCELALVDMHRFLDLARRYVPEAHRHRPAIDEAAAQMGRALAGMRGRGVSNDNPPPDATLSQALEM